MEQNFKRARIRFNRYLKLQIIAIIILMLIPVIFIVHSNTSNTKINIGIVLTTKQLISDGQYAVDGLNDFEQIFNTKIVDVIYNESSIRIKDSWYLTDDYFDSKFVNDVREKHNVDIVMILTDKKINNWLGNGFARWGIANTELAMTLVTTAQYEYNATQHQEYIVHTSIHEILHVLGYKHPTDNRECLMRYASPFEVELNFEYRCELPYRVQLWKVGIGYDFVRACFLIDLAILLIFSSAFFGIILLFNIMLKKRLYRAEKMSHTPLIMGLGIYFINILFISAFFQYFYTKILLLALLPMIYVIIELIRYLMIQRAK